MSHGINAMTISLILVSVMSVRSAGAETTPFAADIELSKPANKHNEKWTVIDGPNQVFARAGIDPALGVVLGYGRGFDLFETGRHWELFGEFEGPFTSFGKNGAATAGAFLPIVRYGYFRFSTEVSFEVGWLQNRNYRSVRFAPGLTLLPGVGARNGRWYIDGVFGYQRAVSNHIKHTEYYREVFYDDAKNGWYYGTGGRFRMGARIGFLFNRWRLELRAAHDRTERFRTTGGSPFSATLGAGVRF